MSNNNLTFKFSYAWFFAILMLLTSVLSTIFLVQLWGVYFDDLRFWLGIVPMVILGILPLIYITRVILGKNKKK